MSQLWVSAIWAHTKYACFRCSACIEPSSSMLGRCTNLSMPCYNATNFPRATLSEDVLIMAGNSKIFSLTAYSKVVRDMAEVTQVSKEGLINTPKLSSLTYNEITTSFLPQKNWLLSCSSFLIPASILDSAKTLVSEITPLSSTRNIGNYVCTIFHTILGCMQQGRIGDFTHQTRVTSTQSCTSLL